MNGPELRLLVRSLRTKTYASLPISKHLAALTAGQKGTPREIPPEEEPHQGPESHGQDDTDSESV